MLVCLKINLRTIKVYMRLDEDMAITDISDDDLEDAAQLVKANSIQGCKLSDVAIVVRLWTLLEN